MDSSQETFQLKGSMFTLSVLQVQSTDLDQLDKQLKSKVKQAPQFFNYAPVVIDFNKTKITAADFSFESLSQVLRKNKLLPVGIRGCSPKYLTAAREAGFATLLETDSKKNSKHHQASSSDISSDSPKTMLITKPIRSGQQVYAQNADLIVVSSVSPGAELLADGNIHVYGTLKGRALAGVNGDKNARIFCQKLQAELISIAGQYKVFEDGKTHDSNHSIQIYLEDGQLVITSL